MTQIAFTQLFDRRGGLGTVDHCESCGARLVDHEPCDCDTEDRDGDDDE